MKSEFDIFVPKNQESEFCETHQMVIERYPNGAIVIQTNEPGDDKVYGHVSLNYRNIGSYFDPKEKLGLHHLFEHLAATPPHRVAMRQQVNFNASTGIKDMDMYVNGTANTSVKNYGIWPVIEKMKAAVTNPLGYLENLDEALFVEKSTILGEIKEREISPHSQSIKAVHETVFSKTNPILLNTIGDANSLAKIESDDLIAIAKKVYEPGKVVLSVYNEGDFATNNAITKEFVEYVGEGSQNESNSKFDLRQFDEVRPDIETAPIHTFPSEINHGLVTLSLVWILNEPNYTLGAVALQQLLPALNNASFVYSRGLGLGYSANAYEVSAGQSIRCCVISLNFPKRENVETFVESKLIPGISRHISTNLSDSEIAFMAQQEQLKQLAVPMNRRGRMNLAVRGLISEGKIINGDAVKEMNARVGVRELKDVLNQLLDNPPIKILSGDLS